jgi:hypothetical protein
MVVADWGDQIVEMTPVWVVDRNGSAGLTDPVITADTAVMLAAPAAARYPATFYLPKQSLNPLAPVINTTPVYRGNSGQFYTKDLNDYRFTLEETLGLSWPDALDGSTREIMSPRRTPGVRGRVGRSLWTRSERSLGYAFRYPQEYSKFLEDFVVTVTGGTQQHTIKFDRRAGGHLTDWRVEIPGSGIDVQIVSRGGNYGRGMQGAWFMNEQVGDPAQVDHNPTQAGSVYSSRPNTPYPPVDPGQIVDDWETQASPTLALWQRSNPDGSVTVHAESLALDFFPEKPLGQAQGTAFYQPVAWLGSRMAQTWTFNFGGREGVHKIDWQWYQPFVIPFAPLAPSPGPLVTRRHQAHLMFPRFDEFWVYDAVNQTDTECREGIEGPAYDGSDDNDGFVLGVDTWFKGARTSPRRPPVGNFAPHPVPSGIGGLINLDTGTFWGTGSGMAIGTFIQIFPINSVGPITRGLWDNWSYGCNYTTDLGFGETKDGHLGPTWFTDSSGVGGYQVGWHQSSSLFCTGTYGQVTANMRQLYLDGLYGQAITPAQALPTLTL